MKYKRILLKLSGEALMGEKPFGLDSARIAQYAEEIKAVIAEAVGNFTKAGAGEHRRLLLSNYITNPSDFKTNAILYSADMGGMTSSTSNLSKPPDVILEEPMANSSIFNFPSITAPLFHKFSVTVLS